MEIKSDEVWIEIQNTPYSVSSLGSVRNNKRKKTLKQSILSGYPSVAINGKRQLIHRIALTAFVGSCPYGMEACHNNGDKKDNRIENLRWDTHSNNCLDKRNHGTANAGEKNIKAKISDKQAEAVAKIYTLVRMKYLTSHYNMTDTNIRHIAFGKTRHKKSLNHLYESNKKMSLVRVRQSQQREF